MTLQPEYVFADRGPAHERRRLLAVQDEFDPATFQRLARLNVQPGWNCLEIGCGAGSVLRWLADSVGPTGRVVGLDLHPEVAGEPPANSQLRQGDVAAADLGEGTFDLAHARFVLVHVRQRDAALANVVRALKPGGWLLLEEPDFGPAGPAQDAGVIDRVFDAMRRMYLNTGGDPFLGRQLPGWLQRHGLVVEAAEAAAALWQGGSQRARLRRQAVEQLWPRLLATSAVTEDDLKQFLVLTEDPAVWAYDYTTVAAWARRP